MDILTAYDEFFYPPYAFIVTVGYSNTRLKSIDTLLYTYHLIVYTYTPFYCRVMFEMKKKKIRSCKRV